MTLPNVMDSTARSMHLRFRAAAPPAGRSRRSQAMVLALFWMLVTLFFNSWPTCSTGKTLPEPARAGQTNAGSQNCFRLLIASIDKCHPELLPLPYQSQNMSQLFGPCFPLTPHPWCLLTKKTILGNIVWVSACVTQRQPLPLPICALLLLQPHGSSQ